MSYQFPIFEVPVDAAEAEEAMGSRFKFWFKHPEFGNCLFKQTRSNTGEDWTEKIAAELAQLLGLPHATYELAVWRGQNGVISPNFLLENTALIHGNDILAGLASNYPRDQGYRLSQHTVSIVCAALKRPGLQLPLGWVSPPGITEAISTFVGYLLLDAWIGNGDRHHENWGFVVRLPEGIPHLAPTYDHASCLGRELLDAKRQEKLQQQTVKQYTEKSRSAFYQQQGDRRPMLTFDVFVAIARQYPRSAKIWLNQLAKISLQEVKDLLQQVPGSRISPVALEFGYQMLEINRSRLLRLQKDLT
ncbi:HipA-like protein [Oscillatoria sp. FACHB-1407]|uniref:HipA-like protein n=1 Tax=Oscillatoria sp. FACHB-1407 TaxID=2692847 RepID=UPI0016852F40|nr:HipA-like protein [Oscillatoria sp. FACHB-1407]MBD2465506.1 HipA-like protein [Oscillatoria sp. FACHB-1407]